MTDSTAKEIEELRQQRADLDKQLQKKGYEIADLKRRICDELYTYPAYVLLETLISLRKTAITPEAAPPGVIPEDVFAFITDTAGKSHPVTRAPDGSWAERPPLSRYIGEPGLFSDSVSGPWEKGILQKISERGFFVNRLSGEPYRFFSPSLEAYTYQG
jgi:hypothetical protein